MALQVLKKSYSQVLCAGDIVSFSYRRKVCLVDRELAQEGKRH